MTRLSTLPSTREQARRALLLLGAPAPLRLVAGVHGALFDGDLTVAGLVALLREEEHAHRPGDPSVRVCPALRPDLSAVPGLLTLSGWPLAGRVPTPADRPASIVRVAGFVAVRDTASAAAAALLRTLAAEIPGGPEAYDVQHPAALADLARTALATVPVTPLPDAVVHRWEGLDERQRLFGVPALPRQRERP